MISIANTCFRVHLIPACVLRPAAPAYACLSLFYEMGFFAGGWRGSCSVHPSDGCPAERTFDIGFNAFGYYQAVSVSCYWIHAAADDCS